MMSAKYEVSHMTQDGDDVFTGWNGLKPVCCGRVLNPLSNDGMRIIQLPLARPDGSKGETESLGIIGPRAEALDMAKEFVTLTIDALRQADALRKGDKK